MKNKLLLTLAAVTMLAAAAAATRAESGGDQARRLWEALDLMARAENLPLHVIDGDSDTISVRSLECASEMYDACSLFAKVNGEEKLVVHLAAAHKIIESLYEHGIYPAEDDPSMSQAVKRVSCTNHKETYSCALEEWD